MRNLSDKDIAEMIGADFSPDASDVRRRVRTELHLATRIPQPVNVPENVTLDLHMKTIEQSWDEIM